MNPTDYKVKVDFSHGGLRPKRRCKPAEVTVIAATLPLPMSSFDRVPRIKRTARPHPQVWVRRAPLESTIELKPPGVPNAERKTSHPTPVPAATACLSILRRYNNRLVEQLKAKAQEIFAKLEPRVALRLKRIGTLGLTVISTLAALRAHGSAKF